MTTKTGSKEVEANSQKFDWKRLSLHQREYEVLRKGLEVGLSKEQLANLFKNRESIKSPIEGINKYIASGGVA